MKIGVNGRDQEKYDAVISTVPLGVLKKKLIYFASALSAQKRAAIASMGALDKLYLHFEDPFWGDKSNIRISSLRKMVCPKAILNSG